MPWGITLLAALSVLLLFKVGDKLLKRLNISMMAAQILIFMLVAGTVLPGIQIGNAVAFSIGGFIVPLLIGIVILKKGNRHEVFRGLLCAVCVGASLVVASYFIDPIPQGYIFEPQILYGLIASIIAFIVGYNLVSALSGVFLGVVLWDIAQGLIVKYVYHINVPIELGLYGILNTMIPALIIVGLASYLIAEKHEEKRHSKKRLRLTRRNEVFEISDEITPDKNKNSKRERKEK